MMERLPLTSFYRLLTSWPRSTSELAIATEKAQKLLGSPAVVLWIPEVGLKLAGTSATVDRSMELFVESAVREKMSSAVNGRNKGVEQIPLPRDNIFTRGGVAVDALAVARITGETRSSESSVKAHREKKLFGWLIAAIARPLPRETEERMEAAALHLGQLAVLGSYESALAQRDQFLSIASHELKTPLTSIYGILQLQERMLRPQPGKPVNPDQERQHSFFKLVIRQVERLNELIDGLLNVSRIANGRFAVDPSESDISSITTETVRSRLDVIAQEAGVKIQLDVEPQVWAWVDPIRFEEVVTNLGMNAIRFSPEGGVVWIKLKTEDESIRLTFHDQGPNVPEVDRGRIFQPFERAQRTARLGGLGLGLFISRQIAQLHGGDVSLAESIPGQGNVFEARFPRRHDQESSQEAGQEAGQATA